MSEMNEPEWLEQVNWNADGLLPAIAQDHASGRVLMLAWMNREALELTCAEGRAVYWSRSRNRLWRKGETIGPRAAGQGNPAGLRPGTRCCCAAVEQHGGIACHTGRESCFYLRKRGTGWEAADPVLKDPAQIYDK